MIQVQDEHDNTLFIEMSRDDSYWNVNSAGIFRKGYSNKKETVAKTEPQQPNNAISDGSSLSTDAEGGITSAEPNGEPTVSAGKVTEKENSVQTSIANAEQETETTDKAEASNSIRSAFDNLKKQASDRMLIFKEGGNYEILYEDAKKADEILELPVQKKDGKTFVSFPIKDLDKNLPLLIRRGVTVAITEALREGKRLFSELEKTF